MIEFILPAMTFGLAAGLKPGPLGVVVIQQTLSRGMAAGVRASLAPIITDAPIILAAHYSLSNVKDMLPFIALLSFIGGVNLIFISKKIFNIRMNDFGKPSDSSSSFWIGVRVNFLNPNPYLFWFTIGGSYLLLGTPVQSSVFILVSIGSLILSKIFIAFLALYFRDFLSSNGYLYVMKFLAVLMGGFGLQLLYMSCQISGLWSYVFT